MGKKCMYCGASLPEDASFCPRCAKSLIEKTEIKFPRPWRRKLLRALACTLALAVLAGAFLLYPSLLSRYTTPADPDAPSVSTGEAPAVLTTDPDVPSVSTGEAPAVLTTDPDVLFAPTIEDPAALPTETHNGVYDSVLSLSGEPAYNPMQIVEDAVTALLRSEKFTGWQAAALNPKAPEVTAVYHYYISDFEGEEMDCYLVSISADICYTAHYGDTQQDSRCLLFISSDGATVIDAVSEDIQNYDGDVSTYERRAAYLLCIWGNSLDGYYHSNGYFVNSSERVSSWSAETIANLNSRIGF